MSKTFYFVAGFLLLLIPIAFFIMPSGGFEGDLMCWVRWAKSVELTGLGRAYTNPEIVYHPFFLEMLFIYAKIYKTEFGLITHLQVLKAMIFIFDIAAIIILAWFLDKKNIPSWKSLIILFCPAYFYNTICWGQVDCIHTTFCFAAIILALNRKYLWSIVLYLLAFSMKFQAIIFAPIIAVLLIPYVIESWKQFGKTILVKSITVLVLLLPFILQGQVMNFFKVTTVAVNYFPVVSMHAYNIWFLIFPNVDLLTFPDTQMFLGITYKLWGHILFFLGIIITLVPLLPMLKKLYNEKSKYVFSLKDTQMIFLYCALVPIFFFFFNTQMHERYAHPAVIFAGAFAILSGRYLFFSLFSVAYFLNLEKLIHYFHFPENLYKSGFIFNDQFIAMLYLSALGLGIYHLFNLKNYNHN